jgi:peptide/nickel transport system substrate-binding protein
VLSWIFPGLMRFDERTRELRPVIAREPPEVAADKLSYVYRIREDVTFSDGKPLTADDVVFTMKAIKHPRVNAPHTRNYFNSVRDAVALDRYTVRFELAEPYFLNDYQLGGISPIPRHYYDPENLLEGIEVRGLNAFEALPPEVKERATRFATAFNEEFHRRPLGPGAFALRSEADLITGERIVLRHRDDYWGAGHPELEDAWVDRIVYRVINDAEAALVALKAGDLDLLGLTPIQHLKQTSAEDFRTRFDKHVEVLGGFTYIGWNQKRATFKDARVRQALSHLVDKKNIIDKVLMGLGVPVESPIFVNRPEHNSMLAPYEFSPERAKALLADAGWADTDGDGILDREIDGQRVPLRFEVISNAGNEERKKVGLVAIDEFKKAGIDASFRAMDWSILLEKVRKTFDYDAVILGWTGGGAMPPDAYQIWHSSQAVQDGSNFVDYRNDEVDRILEGYRVEFDAARRKMLYDRFQEILYQEQPYTFLYTPESVTTWDRRFAGVTWYPGLGSNRYEWWVPLSGQKYH